MVPAESIKTKKFILKLELNALFKSCHNNSSCIRDISRLGAKRRRRHSETMQSSFGNKRLESHCKNEAQRLELLHEFEDSLNLN